MRNDGLGEAEIAQTIKFAVLFQYWHRRQDAQQASVEESVDLQPQPTLFDALPYFFEGINPFEREQIA